MKKQRICKLMSVLVGILFLSGCSQKPLEPCIEKSWTKELCTDGFVRLKSNECGNFYKYGAAGTAVDVSFPNFLNSCMDVFNKSRVECEKKFDEAKKQADEMEKILAKEGIIADEKP